MATRPIALGEGPADETFLLKLIEARKLPSFETRSLRQGVDAHGKNGFEERLRGLKLEPGIAERTAILILADNDTDPERAFVDVQNQIGNAGGYAVPVKPREIAASADELPAVAVLMVPWDDEPGCLETICFQASTSEWPTEAKCVDQLVNCVKAESWPIDNLSKLRMRALMSSICKNNPNTGLQYAWSSQKGRPTNLIPLHHKCFNRIADYLNTFK